MRLTRREFLVSTSAILAGAALPASADAYPSRPVKFIVPFPPGGPVDTTARAFTTKLTEYWGQTAIVENRAGAGGIVGAEAAKASPADAPSALPHIRSGRLKALGVGNPTRSALAPEIPTIAEAGLRGYESYSWAVVVIPAATPKDIVAKLNTDIVRALNDPGVKQRLLDAGCEANPGTQAEFAKFLRAEIVKYTQVVKDANGKVD